MDIILHWNINFYSIQEEIWGSRNVEEGGEWIKQTKCEWNRNR